MPLAATPLVRLCSEDEWKAARAAGWIYPEEPGPGSGAGEEFVHLSSVAQVHLPANRLYAGRRDMMLLYVDPTALDSPVRWEPGVPSDPESMTFPHLYGPLPVAAVTKAVSYPPGADGSFPALVDGQRPT